MLLNKVMKYADDNAAFISGKASNDINEKHTEILVGWLNGSLKMNWLVRWKWTDINLRKSIEPFESYFQLKEQSIPQEIDPTW